MNGTETHAYVVRCPHGCLCAASVDDSLTSGHCLKDLRQFRKYAQKDGYSLERILCEEVRSAKWFCDECKKRKSTSGSK